MHTHWLSKVNECGVHHTSVRAMAHVDLWRTITHGDLCTVAVREIVRAVLRKKKIIALLEADITDQHGGHVEDECRRILRSPEYAVLLKKMVGQVNEWSVAWGEPNLRLPTGEEIEDALFATAPIVWYRLADLQDVSFRLMAEFVLHATPGSKAEQSTRCTGGGKRCSLMFGRKTRGTLVLVSIFM